ncbi:hypothetical protein LTR82_012615 [Friedmanniomyces endolithicus]|uniref:Patatin-like phospholipase domain-containing protein n=1 Tax=Friedmanniomyces endolithicus TaxID=329885 RepID=A0AAN6FFE4_9PEZI|nr:hypothetical protein LTR82_012615 [Friedmanniomyces endolithicus]
MADPRKSTDGPSVASLDAWDHHSLPDWDDNFYDPDDFLAFASALSAPETSPSEEDLLNPKKQPEREFITALNDWRPIKQRVRGKQKPSHASTKAKRKRRLKRGRDETREGWTYSVLKYPFLFMVFGWLIFLGISYFVTRLYIYVYEQWITWRGKRLRLRKELREQTSFEDWVKSAKVLDRYLGSDSWKEEDDYAYYDSRTVRRVMEQMKSLRRRAEEEERGQRTGTGGQRPVDDLRALVEACVKNNFAGTENTRLYSETYYGTKDLVQEYVDEVSATLRFLLFSRQLGHDEKRALAKHLGTNFGRTALCLSGGATFAYYHFGIAKALLDADLLPDIITGTSGGALVAALLATRTNEELKKLLVPALAYRINACSEPWTVWLPRWWRTGARFDSVDWARRCSWFCRGSLTFLEAYQRTGRILNVTCVPSDPHSPTILANYLTAPDCVIWSAVLASAAVPGILNPVVLMRKNRDGKLEPYSFGHKWKDGSLRTDIPLKSLNLHFTVNFSVVSQVNPHINLFFFSSRGTVGRPVTHRRGRGWRGGFLGSALEQYLKLDLNKWLKVLRHLELLPRPLGQDWSEVWLQRFSGTITIWPRTRFSDFYYILSDPGPHRLAHMIHAGQLAAWPKLKFIANRMAIEKVIEDAREATRPDSQALPTPVLALDDEKGMRSMLSEEDLQSLLGKAKSSHEAVEVPTGMLTPRNERRPRPKVQTSPHRADSPSLSRRFTGWLGALQSPSATTQSPRTSSETARPSRSDLAMERTREPERRRSSVIVELRRQAGVLWDDPEVEGETASETEEHEEGFGTSEEENAVEFDGDDEEVVVPYVMEPDKIGDGHGTVIRRRPQATASPNMGFGGDGRDDGAGEAMLGRWKGSNATFAG